MQVVLLPPIKEDSCQPITGHSRGLLDCLIANKPLKTWLEMELKYSGFEVVERSSAESYAVFYPAGYVVEAGALCMLAKSKRPTTLFDKSGNILAWKGDPDQEKCTAPMVTEAPCQRVQYPWDLLQLNEQIVSEIQESQVAGDVYPLACIEGNVIIGEGTVVLPGTLIEGNVIIGRNCKIGPNAYIRGYTSIADGCVIGNAVEIKNSVIYPKTYVSHLSYVGDSILGAHVNLGAGTIISNFRHDGRNHRCLVGGDLIDTGRAKFGAIIGDGVRTGVNTSIYPGRKLGRGRTTRPAEVVDRDLL